MASFPKASKGLRWILRWDESVQDEKRLLEISKSPSLYTKCKIIVFNTLRSENANIMKEYLTN